VNLGWSGGIYKQFFGREDMILVTGASGTVGSEVVKQLSGAGPKFRVMFRNKEDKAPVGAEVAIADFNDPDTLRAAMRGVERLFLLCAPVPNLAELEGNAIDAAKAAGVKHIVKLSVIGAAEAAHTFAKPHHQVEEKLRKSGIRWTLLRCNGFMQNFLQFAGTIKSQNAFYSTGERSKASWVDVRDIAAVAAKALTSSGHEGKAYEVTGPEALSYGEIAKKFSAAVGREIKYIAITPEQQREGLLKAGLPQYSVDAILDLMRYYDGGNAEGVSPDVERVTGRKATYFDRFAHDFAAAFKPDVAAAS
jgi:uncharacterized protein YbjT (DUF2867 family)